MAQPPPAVRDKLHFLPFVRYRLCVTWTETFNCDICGKQKGSVDHWWLAWTESYRPHEEAPQRHMFKIYPWENMLAHDANAKHLCGQACLQKLVDRWLNTEMSHAATSSHK